MFKFNVQHGERELRFILFLLYNKFPSDGVGDDVLWLGVQDGSIHLCALLQLDQLFEVVATLDCESLEFNGGVGV